MSIGFVCSDFLKLAPKFFSLSKSHTKNVNKFFNFLYQNILQNANGFQNILQNANTFNGSRETLLFVPPGDQNLTQLLMLETRLSGLT